MIFTDFIESLYNETITTQLARKIAILNVYGGRKAADICLRAVLAHYSYEKQFDRIIRIL